MSGADKALTLLILIGLALAYAMGWWMGLRDHCECPPPPAVKVCKLPLPERLSQFDGEHP